MSASAKKAASEESALSKDEKIIKKYGFLKEKIILHYHKGCKILKVAKITVTVLFLLFTLVAVIISNRTGEHLAWLSAWIILIFVNIAVFVPADYAKYLMASKVIPYLNDDDRVTFGEYDIFAEDLDEEDEEA